MERHRGKEDLEPPGSRLGAVPDHHGGKNGLESRRWQETPKAGSDLRRGRPVLSTPSSTCCDWRPEDPSQEGEIEGAIKPEQSG